MARKSKSIDYTKFRDTLRDPLPRPEADESSGFRWWEMDKEASIAEAVSARLEHLKEHQLERRRQMLSCARLYGNMPLSGFDGLAAYRGPTSTDRAAHNVLQIAVDTWVAKVRKNRPRPFFLTSGGNYKLQRRAKRYNRLVEGVFHAGRVNELAPDCARDGAVFGTSPAHVYPHHGEVRFERVPQGELWVDEIEAAAGYPRTMDRVKDVDRAVLAAAFPDYEKQIASAPRATHMNGKSVTVSDLVRVRQSWRLPSGPKSKDGRVVITLEDCVLADDPWERDHFPFAFFHWAKRLFGFWGQGGVEQNSEKQLTINKLIAIIHRSIHLGGTWKMLVPNGSQIVAEHVNNEIGALLYYTGNTAPQYVVPPLVPPEYMQQVLSLRDAIFESFGINQMAARAAKPQGLGTSGVALREYKDEVNERLATPGENYETFHLDLARLTVETVEEIAGRGSFKVKVPGARFFDLVDWKDVRLDEEQYTIHCFPTSSLRTDPAGRLQDIQELMQAGLLTPREGNRLLNFPDLQAVETLKTAQEDWVMGVLDRIVDEGKDSEDYEPPQPFMDLQLAHEMALQYLAEGEAGGLEEHRLEALRRFIGQVQDEMGIAAAGATGAVPAAPQAVPEAPPVSPMLPTSPNGAAA